MTPIFAMMIAAAAPATPLKVDGPWTVDFAEKVCGLGRQYQAASGKIVLLFRAPLVGREYSVYVVRPRTGSKFEYWGAAFIQKPNGTRVGPFPLQAFTNTSLKRVVRFAIDPEKYRLTEDGSLFSVDLGREGNFSFAVPNLPKALRTLEECTKLLRKDYGIDQQVIDRVVVEAKQIGMAFDSSDYPTEAVKKELQGDVGVLVFVGTDGRISDCQVIESSTVPSLDNRTCAVLESRARFEPARDAQGAKMRAPYYARIRWRLPG